MRHQTVAGETIRQIAYVTSPGTFGATIDFWLRTVGVGPFYVADFRLGNQTFRGEPTDCTCRAGLSFQGDVQVEIIEPTNDAPSPYREALDRAAVVPSAGLFHHFLVDTADFEGTCRRLLDGGALEGMRATLPDGRRLTYIDATAVIGSYVEVIEIGSASAAVSARMREECAEWDGTDPVRSYYDLVARATQTDRGDQLPAQVSHLVAAGPGRDHGGNEQ